MSSSTKKAIVLLSLFVFSMLLWSCDGSSTSTSTVTTSTTSQPLISELSASSLEDESSVRWIGRTYYDESQEKMFFYHTATGFTVTFYGTSLSIQIQGTNTSSSSKRPYFTVSVDDEVAPAGRVIHLEAADALVTLVDGLNEGTHTVTLLKRSEPTDSITSITNIETDGYFLSPTEASDFKVLVVGASGISGHGNLGSAGQARTTANSDSLQAFGYLAASYFSADVQFISASGWGLVWGYNSSNEDGTINIRSAFETVGIADNQELIDVSYDVTSFVPDFIIVNIGGNDFTSYVSKLSGIDAYNAKAEFRAAVVEICSYWHELYPESVILWTHTSGSQNGAEAEAAIGDLDPRHEYTQVVVIKQVGEDGDPVGADGHAGLTTHYKNAQILIDVMNSVLAENNN